jgi:hypothetical protein
MSTLPIKLCHVRSHQDEKNSSAKINFEAQMNILADHEATGQKNKMTGPADDVRNIAIAQLRIGGVAITRDSQRWILQAAGKIPIQQYYWERHGWNDDTFNNICWETQRAILQTYNQDDQTRIIKFVHGWLPTRHRQAKEGTAVSPGCSLCTAVLEDNLHLFVCRHKEMERHQAKLATHISKWLQEHGDSEITNLFDLGLQESAHPNRSWKPDMRHVSVKWRKAVEAQNEIGWHHIFYGRIAKDLKTAMDQHYQEEGAHDRRTNGEQWARKLIRTIWDTMLALWGERNKILNKQDDDIARAHQKEATEQRVRRCYAYKDNLRHSERIQWFSAPLHEMIQKDTRSLATWANTVERIINITKREKKKRPKESLLMERFLNLRSQTPTRTPTPTIYVKHPKRFSQELHPD